MVHPVARLLLGSGTLRPDARTALQGEGILLLEEGLRGHVTRRHWRAPGERATWRRDWIRAVLVVTRGRLAVHGRRGPLVNVPWADPRMASLTITADGRGLLIVADAGLFHRSRSGGFEVLVRPADPVRSLELILLQAGIHGHRVGG
ncbi:hypothetical protein [Patulibacter minatonensis]|uniref:hypothetical protein n=1 Tax=Patulibacter minatonensis TaxID=298163 RepID=UPI0004BB8E40|nr:hypothetical protein [Patulibacter minatonensis]